MIKPNCDICKKELEDYGALLFSPPEDGSVKKTHICKNCYNELKENYKI